jgi:hypothetical protein
MILACLEGDERTTLFMRRGAPVGHGTYIGISAAVHASSVAHQETFVYN